MRKVPVILLMTLFLTACGGEGTDASTEGEAATAANKANPATKKSNGRSRDPKWVIAIDGFPEKSGTIITAVTMGTNGRYTLGRSGFTASIEVLAQDPRSNMMITFSEDNAHCFNGGEALVTIDGDRALLSGQVTCMPKEGGKERSDHAIEGWFDIKKQ